MDSPEKFKKYMQMGIKERIAYLEFDVQFHYGKLIAEDKATFSLEIANDIVELHKITRATKNSGMNNTLEW